MKQQLTIYKTRVEAGLEALFQERDVPPRLAEAMRYSLLAGGKRLRPVLCLAWAEMLDADPDSVLPFACGIECIHTYSLIHDDLPAMDNDALRRGKPTNHVMFGEAMAILAGDGLLTEAFGLMLQSSAPPNHVLRAVRIMAEAAGCRGMVGGQVLDMLMTGSNSDDLAALKRMHQLKTGALIRSSCLSGAMLAGGDATDLRCAEAYGAAIGLSFQVVDDILDVVGDEKTLGKPIGSDQGQGKVTYPALLGLEKSRSMAQDLTLQAVESISRYTGKQAEFLKELAQYIVDRLE